RSKGRVWKGLKYYIYLMLIKDKWKYHVYLWVTVIGLGLITDFGSGGWKALFYAFSPRGLRFDSVFYFASITIYYINFTYICPRYLSKKRILFFSLGFVALLLLFAGLRYFLDEIFFKFLTGINNYQGTALDFQYYFFDNIYYALPPILYSSVIFLIFRFIEAQNQIMQLKLDHKKAELSFLKSQISPHFLFNTLNTFYSELIDVQPAVAKDIHKLSDLLRFVTYDAGEEFIELKKEIAFIKDYIYFYEKRFESELALDFELKGDVKNQTIASLVLMHFIENVFKHGVLTDKDDPAKIEIHIEETSINISTNNKIQQSIKYMEAGIGVENLKKRLDTIYDQDYELHYAEEGDYFSAYLTIPI
ncbi:MAG: histidine kinase, partial [Saprospiraceae bacterium]|nr:histidine kinase [Saprospiraceae bacterium]